MGIIVNLISQSVSPVGHSSLTHSMCKISDIVFFLEMLIFPLFMQSALPQRGGEVNITLGGIDLNNSGRYE